MRMWIWLALSGCYSASAPEYTLEPIPDRFVEIMLSDEEESSGGMRDKKPKEDDARGKLIIVKGDSSRGAPGFGAPAPVVVAPSPAPSTPQAAPEAALRQWFPEAFLWQPLVETNATGSAQVEVRVPDQLTTWRVLALAHDRAGHQAGAVHTFDGSLPAYVDPVVPGWMHVGDVLTMPVQVVNNAAEPLSGSLVVVGSGAVSAALADSVAIGPYGSAVRGVSLRAGSKGQATLSASLPGVDALQKTWTVQPTGSPVSEQRGGTLTGSRSLTLTWPGKATSSELSVSVHPGPLAVLSAELERLQGYGLGAYGYGLAYQAEALAEATGATLDPGALRTHRIRSWQRLVREARSPTAPEAVDLLLALQGAEHGELLESLRARLVRTVVDGQRGDGTWARADRDTLQRVLVQTAMAGRSLPESEAGARLRAQGAMERNQPQIDDGYTAAVLLASGIAGFEDPLLELVRSGLVEVEGRRTVAVPKDVKNAWGSRPSRTEMLAWTALALQAHEPELAGDLVSELMTTYSVQRGFGAGPADAIALEAVVKALPTIDTPIQLSLALDGQVVSRGTVDPSQPKVPAILSGVPASSSTQVTLTAEPAGAGLAFVINQRSWVPWSGDEGLPGIGIEVSQGELVAGIEGELRLALGAPSGATVRVVQGLPPGMTVDAEALAAVPGVVRSRVDPDRVEIVTHAFGAAEILEIPLRVTPTYAGRMVSRALEVEVDGRSARMAPWVWRVK